ncbi:MAG: pilus assembly protein TadG-related protein, partial [Boseongicola sp.]|nr:pilus assembly protein TadG-related protein [Boseongicola sp.]
MQMKLFGQVPLRSPKHSIEEAVRNYRFQRFAKDDEGSLTIFALFLFICMLMFGGIALDVMLYENQRTHIQNSTDRAVLAAANLDQTVDPKVVVQDYLAKVGIQISQDDVQVTEIGSFPVITGRQVSISVEPVYNTMLMNMVGVDTLPLSLTSEATEAINDIEVSLVLDISGSMGSNSKLENMQDAAQLFVDEILAGSSDNRVSVSLVPYSTQVSAGPDLFAELTTTNDHTNSYCVQFGASDYLTTGIDPTETLSQTAHFDPWRSWRRSATPSNFVCRTESHAQIQPWTNNAQDLKDQIELMTAGGNTSIDVAVKWASALLDPSMNEELNALRTISGSNIPSEFSSRPFAYNREDTLKFIVVMTDGINTTQYDLVNAYKSGVSNLYRDTATGNLSVRDDEYQDYDGDGDWWEDYFIYNLDG